MVVIQGFPSVGCGLMRVLGDGWEGLCALWMLRFQVICSYTPPIQAERNERGKERNAMKAIQISHT